MIMAGCVTPPPATRPAIVAPPRKPAQGARYSLRPGDTLYSIAHRFGVDWRDILDANPDLDPRRLEVGATVIIPGVSELPPEEPEQAAPPENPGHPGPIPAESRFIWPVRGRVIGRFGRPVPWRMGEPNRGVDIRAEPGATVVAAKSGRVNTFQDVPGYGKVVVLEHQDGTVTFYGHNARILVRHGTWVKQGEPIALAGASGLSGGTEVHFRIMRNGQFVDPVAYLQRD